MANHYFGNIGDVWKHLALAELLERERPLLYWESHAGDAEYVGVDQGRGRDLGVHHFLGNFASDDLLHDSRYARLLADRMDDHGRLRTYPGSAAIAMSVLEDGARFVFCDSDSGSTESISRTGRAWSLGRKVECIAGDGVGGLAALASVCSPDALPQALALVDPFEPLERTASGSDPLDLFALLADRGVKVLLWYVDDLPKHPQITAGRIRDGLRERGVDLDGQRTWWGDLYLDRTDTADDELSACGLLTTNLSPQNTAATERLGERLAALYPGSAFWPKGASAAGAASTAQS